MASNELVITFKGDTNDALNKVGGLRGALGGLGDFAGGALKVGLIGAAAGVTALAGGLAAAVGAAMEAEEGQAQLAAVLASTGGKAGMTAESVNALASSLQDVTRFEDDAILGAQNLLLTFTNVGKDVFPQATETILNMSQALGQDLKSSATQLGKALNDPINGMTALSRVGVTFTDEQKNMIKTLQESGDLMGAQKIILAELETEFGGAARAAGDTFAGKLDILNHKFGDIMEAIGGLFIPLLTQAADAIIAVMGNPAVQAAIDGIGQGIALVASEVQNLFQSVTSGGGGGMFEAFFTGLEGLRTVFQGLIDWLTGSLGPALQESFSAIATAAMPTLQMFGDWIQTTLLPALQQLVEWLGPILGAALQGLGVFITQVALPALTALAVWVFEKGLPAFGNFANQVGGVLNAAFKEAARLWGLLVKGFQDGSKFVLETKVRLEEIARTIMTTVNDAFTFLMTNIIDPAVSALAGLKQKIQEVIDMFRNLATAAAGGIADFIPDIPGVGGIPFGGGGGANPFAAPNFAPAASAFSGNVRDVHVHYAPTVSLLDEVEAETKLKPFVQSAVRAAMMG